MSETNVFFSEKVRKKLRTMLQKENISKQIGGPNDDDISHRLWFRHDRGAIQPSVSFTNTFDKKMCKHLKDYFIGTFRDNKRTFVIDYLYLQPVGEKNCAILIVQKGECNSYDENDIVNFWTVRLICSTCTEIPKVGTYLMSLYIYALKLRYDYRGSYQKIEQPYGVLELEGDALSNPEGYCNYTKFGFIPNPEINCKAFENYNIKMVCDINRISYNELVKIMRNETVKPKPYICEKGDKNLKFVEVEIYKKYIDDLKDIQHKKKKLPISKTYGKYEMMYNQLEKNVRDDVYKNNLLKKSKSKSKSKSSIILRLRRPRKKSLTKKRSKNNAGKYNLRILRRFMGA